MINELSTMNSSALGSVNLGNLYISNQLNLGNLWLKIYQSKITNYAKQTQFSKSQNCCNLSKNNELQRTMNYELLFKTNPIKPNLGRQVRL
jgi:hypothetical protein